MGAHLPRTGSGFTIIEVMLFFGVTGALMLGVMGSASVGVNTQRYSDAVNTFAAIVQQEFTKATNVSNTKSTEEVCGLGYNASSIRGVSNCVIIGRLLTVDVQGNMVHSNLVGREPAITSEDDSELKVIRDYNPSIDTSSQESDTMSWGTNLEKGSSPAPSAASILILRSPRSGNVYSYVVRPLSGVITTSGQLNNEIDALLGASTPPNGSDQYLCIDRSGWVVSPVRAIKLSAYSSGPSGVNIVNAVGSNCA